MALSTASGPDSSCPETAAEDIYDFSGLTLGASSGMDLMLAMGAGASSFDPLAVIRGHEDDDEEWYPPTPPPYDVADKLAEANQRLRDDPTSSTHVANRLRWRPGSKLVEVKWLYSDEDGQSSVSSVSSYNGNGVISATDEIVIIDDFADLRIAAAAAAAAASSIPGCSSAASSSASSASSPPPSFYTSGLGAPTTTLVQVHRDNGLSESRSEEEEGEEEEEEEVSTAESISMRTSISPKETNSAANVQASNNVNARKKASRNNNIGGGGGNNVDRVNNKRGNGVVVVAVESGGRKSKKEDDGGGRKGIEKRGSCNNNNNSGSAKTANLRRSRSVDNNRVVLKSNNRVSVQSEVKKTNSGKIRRSPSNEAILSSRSKKRGLTSSASMPDLEQSTIVPLTINLSPIASTGSSPDSDHLNGNVKKTISFHNGTTKTRSSTANPVLRSRLSAPPILQRKISRNSLSSNSSLSSHSTEDSDTNLKSQKEAADQAYVAWKQRKKEEKRLRERRVYLQAQIRRHL